ncbi:GatB/YqeY domain-containing protein [Ectothiorhodospira lacustris]|uniref:GatB/YqeY domain-containing protein n=2 Tax=Ectothiorhodospira lacustris TaxID=2899127 RepID=UPI001EE81031|nr:GatB/YqeY domain-containing protein [Ectothiorhodospira lacustris]MCG5509836.1 GatB/YqeY domain-containing protein [Ectothiorhodospira lacustris]MCG5521089.1 GatB/YqeY domain-containing protein [Ectothiorhodospira lacustris]
MTTSSLKPRITEDMKAAMRGGDKSRLGTVRLILAAIKQVEVDSRTELDDTQVLAILDKMVKQRRESITQYQQAGRDDLVQVEQAELEVIQAYLPQALTDDEIRQMIDAALTESGAESARDMGKVMNLLKPRMQGRADMAAVSGMVKSRLS